MAAPERCGAPQASSVFCVGPCCAPLARNRSCHFTELLFRPPAPAHRNSSYSHPYFAYLWDERVEPRPSPHSFVTSKRSTYFSAKLGPQRYAAAGLQGDLNGERFAPQVVPLSSVNRVRWCVTTPLFIGSTLHWNFGHNALDLVFPAVAAIARLRHAASSARRGSAQNSTLRALSEPGSAEPFIFLESEPQGPGPYMARYRQLQEWTGRLAGSHMSLDALAAACPEGWVIKHAIVGVGHMTSYLYFLLLTSYFLRKVHHQARHRRGGSHRAVECGRAQPGKKVSEQVCKK